MPIPYVIDFNGLTMNTTVANDKLVGNVMEEVKNCVLSEPGKFKKRQGLADLSSGGHPGNGPTSIRAIAPLLPGGVQGVLATSAEIIVLSGAQFYYFANETSAPATIGSAIGENGTIWQLAWGLNSSQAPVVYFSRGNTYRVTSAAHTTLGSGTFTTSGCAEYHLDKLFVGATTEGGTSYRDRLRWTVTGDDDDWTGVGSGFVDLRFPGGGTGTVVIRALRKYRNRLYIGTSEGLWLLTGSTSATFGTSRIRSQKNVIGSTMYEVDDFLFYVDAQGLWQFNGTQAINVMSRDMHNKWESLVLNDIVDVTATWDEQDQWYGLFFPNLGEMWKYYYKSSQWTIWSTARDGIAVVSPPAVYNATTHFIAGEINAGTTVDVYKYPSGSNDDAVAITASFKTGHIRLGEQGGGIGAQFRIEGIDIETVQQDEAGVVKIQMTIDGTAGTQETLTVGDAGASADTFPTIYNGRDGNTQIDLTDLGLTGHTFQMEVTDDDANSRCDIRRIVVWYEPLPGKQDA